MSQCCVEGCQSRSDTANKSDGLTFHMFPKDEQKKEMWVRAVGCEGWTPSSASVVCSRHFDRDCFYHTRTGRALLLLDAVPSLAVSQASVPDKETSEKETPENLLLFRTPSGTVVDLEKVCSAEVKRLISACKKQQRTAQFMDRKLRETSMKLQ